LAACLDSIFLSVGDEKDVEIIAIDDGSTDSSGSIIDRYAEQDNRIHVIHQANGGVSAARNAGLACAGGEYIAWIDPDDYVAAEWYPRIREIITECRPDLILLDMASFDDHSKTCKEYGKKDGMIPTERFLSDIVADVHLAAGMPNKVVRRDFWEGVRFDTSLKVLEDYAIIYALVQKMERVYYTNGPLYFYRQHPRSLIHSISSDHSRTGLILAEKRCESVPEYLRRDAQVALGIQRFMFCRYCILSGKEKEQYSSCLRDFRKQAIQLLCYRRLPFLWRIKFFVLAAGLLTLLFRIKTLFLVKKVAEGER